MRKIIFGVFAHPDDESFGPSGVLLDEARSGNDVHLITLTLGEAGANPDNHPNLAEVREQEWRKAGGLIGAKSMHCLRFKDSQLNNYDMVAAQEKLLNIISGIVEHHPADTEVEFIIADTNGITGHIDHIVASRAALYAFYKLKVSDNRYKRVRITVMSEKLNPTINTNWLYMEKGRTDSEITETIDVRHLRDEIIEIMQCHNSQRADVGWHIKTRGDQIGIYHFMIQK